MDKLQVKRCRSARCFFCFKHLSNFTWVYDNSLICDTCLKYLYPEKDANENIFDNANIYNKLVSILYGEKL